MIPNGKNDDPRKDNEKTIILTESELREIVERSTVEIVESIEMREEFSGPIPHPNDMRGYMDIDSDLPNRIISMAEKNQNHRIWIEKFMVMAEAGMAFLGWLTPTAISFYVLYAAVGFVNNGKSIEAFISLVVALGSLGSAFYIKQKNSDRVEEE